ncbi:MAG: penicillin-insensitive murein endopeptidase [Methylobacteriaceae bacterium]|jgi:penicillin-insensitive murein endopeptidase|nr:penicillin-insensitive murein endopeptidase [Methylobacteriaceae bacterium]
MKPSAVFIAVTAVVLCGWAADSLGQDKGSVNPTPLQPLKNITKDTPAKELFGRKTTPAEFEPTVVGFYSKGCLAGAEMMPHDGEHWQVMRPSRNRNWAHPRFIAFLKEFADSQPKVSGWPGLLVGDMSQPRGGPMRTGHASHQIGLDADIWLTPMPRRTLTRAERENTSAVNMVRADLLDIDPRVWTDSHLKVLRAAAKDRRVQRIFVNPAIKRALCRDAGEDRAWLNKIRPTWGHNYHFHIRLGCLKSESECVGQAAPPAGDGCGKELDWWFSDEVLHPKPKPKPSKPVKKPKPLVMADLPPLCRTILDAP